MWYLKITTVKGTFAWGNYKTKREAEEQADIARRITETQRVEIVNSRKK